MAGPAVFSINGNGKQIRHNLLNGKTLFRTMRRYLNVFCGMSQQRSGH